MYIMWILKTDKMKPPLRESLLKIGKMKQSLRQSLLKIHKMKLPLRWSIPWGGRWVVSLGMECAEIYRGRCLPATLWRYPEWTSFCLYFLPPTNKNLTARVKWYLMYKCIEMKWKVTVKILKFLTKVQFFYKTSINFHYVYLGYVNFLLTLTYKSMYR